ncbi:MAG: hypothetical protein GY789_05015 [Hyphomicrobiales bacterium]|nr:hypothetical protein [Hyphomicrobiales bacterium]MCP5037409.1 hypothetical protein [Paracoccaceae bacterium]
MTVEPNNILPTTSRSGDEKPRQLHDVYTPKSADEAAKIYDGWAAKYEAHMAGAGYSNAAMVASMLSSPRNPD